MELRVNKPGFCPEFKSIGTNGPLGLKKVAISENMGPK